VTDLEITKACADAVGLPYRIEPETEDGEGEMLWSPMGPYNPLHDDAQAMALVKEFMLRISPPSVDDDIWVVDEWNNCTAQSNDLNRAICECVAKMREAKHER